MTQLDMGYIKEVIENNGWTWMHPKEVIKGNNVHIQGILAKQIQHTAIEHHLLLLPICIAHEESMEIEKQTHLETFMKILDQSIEHNTHLIQTILHYLGIEVETQYDLEAGLFYRVRGKRFEIQVQGLLICDTPINLPKTNLSDEDSKSLETLLKTDFELLPQSGIYQVETSKLTDFFGYYEQRYKLLRNAKKKSGSLSQNQSLVNLLTGLVITVLGLSNVLVFFISPSIKLSALLVSDAVVLFGIVVGYIVVYSMMIRKEEHRKHLMQIPLTCPNFVYAIEHYAVFEIVLRTISDLSNKHQFIADHVRVWLLDPEKFNRDILHRIVSEVPELFHEPEQEPIKVLEKTQPLPKEALVEINHDEIDFIKEDQEPDSIPLNGPVTKHQPAPKVISANETVEEKEDAVTQATKEADEILNPPTSQIPGIDELISKQRGFLEESGSTKLNSFQSFNLKSKKVDLDKWLDKEQQNAFVEGTK